MRRTAWLPSLVGGMLVLLANAPAARAAGPDSVTVGLPPPAVRRWQTGAVRPDRLQHATLSAVLACGATLASDEPVAAASGTIALGVLKELHDARRDRFDWGDLAADALGAALGAWIARAASR